MKIAIINDTHFGARNDNSNFNEYFYKFCDDIFFPTLKKNNIKTCIHLGDLMDRRKFVSYKTSRDFRKRFVSPFVEMGIDLHIMIGNHDTFYKNTNDVNSVVELLGGRHDNIKIYSEAEEVVFDDTKILFLPWINSQNTFSSEKIIKETDAVVCMGHLEIAGFQMMKGLVNEHGLSKSIFRKFDSVFSGHFHIKSDDGHIYYLGAPYEIYWSDCDDKKGFHIFDTETREMERIENPYTIHKKVYYDDTQNDYTKFDVNKLVDHYVKVIVVNKKDLYQFDMFVDRLLKADAYEVKIIEDFSELDAKNVSDDIVENTEDTLTLLEKYIDELDITLDKKRLKNTMKSLYNEAQDLEL